MFCPDIFLLSSSLQSVSKIIVPPFTENDDYTYILPCRKWNCMPQWILSSFHPLMREIVCRQMKLNCKLYWLQQQVPFVQTQREPLNCQKDLTLPDTVASDNVFLVPAPHTVSTLTIYDLIYNITGKMARAELTANETATLSDCWVVSGLHKVKWGRKREIKLGKKLIWKAVRISETFHLKKKILHG